MPRPTITTTVYIVLAVLQLLHIVKGSLEIMDSSGSQLPQRPLEMARGGTLSLRCVSPQGRSVAWSRAGQSVANLPRYTVLAENNGGVTVSRLTITNLQTSDTGTLQCSSTSDFMDVRLEVVEVDNVRWGSRVHITDPLSEQLDVNVGQDLFLKCIAGEGTQLKWYHLNQQLEPMMPRLLITPGRSVDDRGSRILLSRVSVELENGGEYRCQDINNPDNCDSVIVNVHESTAERTAITIMESASNQFHVYEGNPYTVKCRADADTEMAWYLNNRLLLDGHDGFTIIEALNRDRRVKTSILSRERADKHHAGTYTCFNLHDDTDLDEVALIVGRKGEERSVSGSIPTKVTQVVMQLGSSVKLQCHFGAPGDHIPEWAFGDIALVHGDKYSINQDSTNSMLTIQNANRADTGMYKCSFKNQNTGYTDGIVEFNISTAPCPQLGIPTYGSMDRCPQNPVYGDSCTYHCAPGYLLSSSEALFCDRAVETGRTFWDKPVPHCTHVSSLVDRSSVPTSVSDVLLRVGEELRLRCSNAGAWSKEDIKLYTGQKYTVMDNELVINNAEMEDAGVYDCTIKMEESNTVGIIKFNVTTLPCPPLIAPPHGTRHGCDDARPVYGATCQFSCQHGYTLDGSRARTCELAHHSQTQVYWTGTPPSCTSDSHESWAGQTNSAVVCSSCSSLYIHLIITCLFLWQQT